MRLAVLCIALASTGAAAQEKQTPVRPPLQAEGGRFVFGQISDFRADQFMIDTKTGRIWQIVVRTNDKGETVTKLLQPIPYSSFNDDRLSPEPR